MAGTGLILSTDLELDIGSLNYIGNSVLAVRARCLSRLHPACAKFLFLLNLISKMIGKRQ